MQVPTASLSGHSIVLYIAPTRTQKKEFNLPLFDSKWSYPIITQTGYVLTPSLSRVVTNSWPVHPKESAVNYKTDYK